MNRLPIININWRELYFIIFLTKNIPTLTHHHHLKSIVYIMVHFWSCISFGFGKMLIMYIHIYNNIQTLFIALKTLCVLLIHSHASCNPWPTLIFFIVSIVLPVPESHIIWSKPCVAFSDWIFHLVICI